MAEWIKRIVLRLVLVPPEPHVPDGLKESIRVFNPGRNYYYLRILMWLVPNVVIFVALAVFLAGSRIPTLPPVLRTIWLIVSSAALAVFGISLPVTFMMQRLNYEMRWYIVTDRSLRIRRGIVSVQELTMTFANIQEIRVAANPLERLLGLANLEVHAAGGSVRGEGQSSGHVASFQGLDNADAIRDLMQERLRIYKDSGLGEQSGPAHENVTAEARFRQEIEGARNVLLEVRALRQSLASQQQ